jgi:signal recognition particle receptor subunit beta
MVFLNYTTMQMTAKIVYYGPGLGGKTTNLQWIHKKTAPASRGEMVSLETDADRTLFFDLLPLDVGVVGGMKVRLQLYTVPGQVFYNATRRLVLKGVDGVVFVADSQAPALEPNEESLANLRQNLEELGVDPRGLPVVFQYNKRDLRNILPVERLQAALNPGGAPAFEAAAIHGVGVFESLREISRRALDGVRARIATHHPDGVPGPARLRRQSPPPSSDDAAPGLVGSRTSPAAEVVPDAVASADAAPPPDPASLEPLQLDFAEEATDKVQVRPVRIRGPLDIGRELEKLRHVGAESRRTTTAVRDRDVERLFQEISTPGRDSEQELDRRASLRVPEHLLKGLTDLRLHLGFDRDGREEIVRDAVRITLVRTRRLRKLRVRLDLDLRSGD